MVGYLCIVVLSYGFFSKTVMLGKHSLNCLARMQNECWYISMLIGQGKYCGRALKTFSFFFRPKLFCAFLSFFFASPFFQSKSDKHSCNKFKKFLSCFHVSHVAVVGRKWYRGCPKNYRQLQNVRLILSKWVHLKYIDGQYLLIIQHIWMLKCTKSSLPIRSINDIKENLNY